MLKQNHRNLLHSTGGGALQFYSFFFHFFFHETLHLISLEFYCFTAPGWENINNRKSMMNNI